VTAPVRDDDEEDEEDAPAPQVSNYPKSEVGSAIDVAIDGFNASRQHDILQIAREILNRLEILADRLQRPVDEAELDEALNAIVTWFDRNRSLLTDD
jgi:hypothetical protein